VLAFLDAQCGDVFPLIAGGTCNGFVENREYIAPVPNGLSGHALLVDEETLCIESYRGGNAWRWRPGFYAGQVEAELRDDHGLTIQRYILDVAPEPGKLGADFFAAMIDDVRAFRSGMLLGTEAPNVGIGTSGDFHSLNVAYGRLRAYGNLFIQAVRPIATKPILRPRHTRILVPAHQVRRVDQQTLRSIVRSQAAVVLGVAGMPASDIGLLDVPGTYESVDNAANRAVLFLLRAVLSRISHVRGNLREAIQKGTDETRTSLAKREAERTRVLVQLEQGVSKLMKATPFDAVTRAELTTAGLNAISASAAYARAYRLAWWILRTGIDLGQPVEKQWMAPTWEIFERWCFLQVMRGAAMALGAEVGDWQIVFKTDCIAVATLHVNSFSLELTMQDTFRAWDVSRQSRVSVSAERRPDMTLVWKDPCRGISKWLVLDSKYTVRRENILATMASAHLYHDSLRMDGQRPCMSLLLTPAACHAAWLMDEAFIDQERVGVVNACDTEALAMLVRKMVSA
jgi:hypothetical protein